MAIDAGAALDGDARRLVENDHLGVLMQQHARQEFVIGGMAQVAAGDRAGLRLGVDIHRRDADDLAWLDAGVGFDAAAIDANLAGAQQLLQGAEAKAGIMNLEPAIEPHAGLVGFHLLVFNARHDVFLPASNCDRASTRVPTGNPAQTDMTEQAGPLWTRGALRRTL